MLEDAGGVGEPQQVIEPHRVQLGPRPALGRSRRGSSGLDGGALPGAAQGRVIPFGHAAPRHPAAQLAGPRAECLPPGVVAEEIAHRGGDRAG